MKIIANVFRLIFYLMAAVVVFWMGSELNYGRRVNPRGKFNTLAEYIERHPDVSRIYKIEKNQNQYIIAHGKVDALLAFPSSPPAYVFDSNGKLIDWAKDPGDNSAFQDKWRSDSREPITREEMKRHSNHGLESTSAPPAAGTAETHPKRWL